MTSTFQNQDVKRAEMIDLLRSRLLELVSGETSICKAVAERGIFCRGFLRFGDAELRQHFAWIDRKLDPHTREELEDVADRWQLARQDVRQLPLACDVQQIEHDVCHGWDDFTNGELSRFYLELSRLPDSTNNARPGSGVDSDARSVPVPARPGHGQAFATGSATR